MDELTVSYEEDGAVVVKELDKEVLSKGAWTTILFRYQELDKRTNEYSPDRYVIRRYQKKDGQYQSKSKFKISSPEQAAKIVATLTRWLG
ncbi:MAG: hypothetical protein M0Z90_06185 [Desulfobacteraceae bacterium]|nr:hypothetical protein [Desulfobacteraceae bacterium]